MSLLRRCQIREEFPNDDAISRMRVVITARWLRSSREVIAQLDIEKIVVAEQQEQRKKGKPADVLRNRLGAKPVAGQFPCTGH